jgi:hypothetical protein
MADENKPESAQEIDIIKKYNEFIEQIPWGSLKALPQKLKKWAPFVGIDNVDDLDLAKPLQDVISFIGVLVKRLRTSEKKAAALEARVAALEAKAKQ